MHIDRAIDLALPDRLLGILAEHRRNLDSLLDERLERKDAAAFSAFRELHKSLISSWTHLHNTLLSRDVSSTLTVREREVSRLAAFGLSNKEIAERLGIEVSTVSKIVLNAMNKTGVDRRRELGAFV